MRSDDRENGEAERKTVEQPVLKRDGAFGQAFGSPEPQTVIAADIERRGNGEEEEKQRECTARGEPKQDKNDEMPEGQSKCPILCSAPPQARGLG